MNHIRPEQVAALRSAFEGGLSIRAAAGACGVNKITANTYFNRFAKKLCALAPVPEEKTKGLTFGEARFILDLGYCVKRADWETYVFGPQFGPMRGYWGSEPEPPPEERDKLWFDLPEELKPGIIGSDYEDDSYTPTRADILANDWEIEP